MPSPNENVALARRYFYEVFNQANFTTLEQICAPDFIFTLPTHAEPFRGVQGYRDLVNMLVSSFPDIHFVIEDMVTEGDRILTSWTAGWTHTGMPFPTVIGDIPAIGNSFSITVDDDRDSSRGNIRNCGDRQECHLDGDYHRPLF